MEEPLLDEGSTSDPFFDALDEFPTSEPEETLVSSNTSHRESVGDAPIEGVRHARLPETPPPLTSLRRRRSSSRPTTPRRIQAADSKTSDCDSPVGSEIITPRERRNKILFSLREQARAGADSRSPGVSSDRTGAGDDPDRTISIVHSESSNRRVEEPAALNGSPPSSGILVSIAGLVIKAIGFQISLLVSSITFPVWLLHCSFLLVTDPFRTLKCARDDVSQKVLRICSVLRALVFERLISQQGIGKWVLRLGLGCFWSFYVCFVLIGCLVSAFLVGRLLVGFVVEEPVRITEELSFDYTKASPVALVPILPCRGIGCALDCSEKVGVGKLGGRRLIPPHHKLQLTISLTLPESDYNQKLGVFQVGAEFLSANGTVTASSSRPCMLRFKSSPIRFVETLFRSGPLLTGYSSESQTLSLKMRGFTEGTEPTACIRVILKQRAEYRSGAGVPEMYATSIRLESELPLFKRIIWNWRRTLFIWISLGIFIFELLFILVCCSPLIIPRSRPRDTSSRRT